MVRRLRRDWWSQWSPRKQQLDKRLVRRTRGRSSQGLIHFTTEDRGAGIGAAYSLEFLRNQDLVYFVLPLSTSLLVLLCSRFFLRDVATHGCDRMFHAIFHFIFLLFSIWRQRLADLPQHLSYVTTPMLHLYVLCQRVADENNQVFFVLCYSQLTQLGAA